MEDFSQRIGKFVIQTTSVEPYKSYIPNSLPPTPSIDLVRLYPRLEQAISALAELNSAHRLIPNTSLFIYMYVRKEALLSSQIEGTQSSFSDLVLFESENNPQISLEDVEEVSNYVKAIVYGLDRLKGGFPISLRLLRDIHAVLMSGIRGATKMPGEFRRSQNWIGGTKPSNAIFVPPSIEYLDQCLSDFELFMHDDSLPLLVKIALVHVQFETIHPFLDGNGRLGRLLITLLLCNGGVLDQPILYFSLYLKQNRRVYYDLLQEVREKGRWEVWLEFFLEGIAKSAKDALQAALNINKLFEEDLVNINSLGRARFSYEEIFAFLKKMPQVTVLSLSQKLSMSVPTIRDSLNGMVELGILEEKTGKQRDKIYVYKKYLFLLEEGAEPL